MNFGTIPIVSTIGKSGWSDNMPIKIEIDPNVTAAHVTGAWGKALYGISAQILGDCNEYVKVDQHTLESSSYEK